MLRVAYGTHPNAAHMQLKLLRAAGTDRRLRLAVSLSRTAIRLSRETIARTEQLSGSREIKLRVVRSGEAR